MEYIDRKVKCLKYDLTNVEIGESIFSGKTGSNNYLLCVKYDTYFRIYKYDNGEIYIMGDYTNFDNISYYIYPDNEIFDKKKTEWVEKMWNDIKNYQDRIHEFEIKIKRRFIY